MLRPTGITPRRAAGTRLRTEIPRPLGAAAPHPVATPRRARPEAEAAATRMAAAEAARMAAAAAAAADSTVEAAVVPTVVVAITDSIIL